MDGQATAERHLPFVFYSNTCSTPSDEKLAMEIGGDAFLDSCTAFEVTFPT